MLEYVAKFIELACFVGDYVATDMVKVRKSEDVLKMSIQGKIVGLLPQDMNSMIKIAMALRGRWMSHGTSGMRMLKISEGFGLRG